MSWYRATYMKERWDSNTGSSTTVYEVERFFEFETLQQARHEAHRLYDEEFNGGRANAAAESWAIGSVEGCKGPEDSKLGRKVIHFPR